jgi:hypothetical protein
LGKAVVWGNGKEQVFDNANAEINAFMVGGSFIYPGKNRIVQVVRVYRHFLIPSPVMVSAQIAQTD